jgi:hypothetical protein
MDFVFRPKKDLNISDNQHLENLIVGDFISFNIYKGRIQRQLDEVAQKTTINGEQYFVSVDLKDKLASSTSPQRKLLNDFGFTDENIQEIINFNNSEDLNYLRLNWKYKIVVSQEIFDIKIEELRALLVGASTITFRLSTELDFAKIDGIEIDITKAQMLYAMLLSGKINHTGETITEISLGVTEKEYSTPSLDITAESLFLAYSGGAEVYEDKYSILTFVTTFTTTTNQENYFWKGYKQEELNSFNIENEQMFYLYDDSGEVSQIDGFYQNPVFNNPYMWMDRDKMRTASKEQFLRGMSKFTNIDWEIDENWFEKFIGGLINAILGLIGTILDLMLSVPILGDILEFVLDNIADLFGLEFEELLIYVKQILLVVVSLIIAWYTGDLQYTQAAIAGWGSASTYTMAAFEVLSMASSLMSSLDLAEAEWNLIENERKTEKEKKEEELDNNVANQSPLSQNADPDAPDSELDFMYEQMFTVPDWTIDQTEQMWDQEPQSKFLNI